LFAILASLAKKAKLPPANSTFLASPFLASCGAKEELGRRN